MRAFSKSCRASVRCWDIFLCVWKLPTSNLLGP